MYNNSCQTHLQTFIVWLSINWKSFLCARDDLIPAFLFSFCVLSIFIFFFMPLLYICWNNQDTHQNSMNMNRPINRHVHYGVCSIEPIICILFGAWTWLLYNICIMFHVLCKYTRSTSSVQVQYTVSNILNVHINTLLEIAKQQPQGHQQWSNLIMFKPLHVYRAHIDRRTLDV